MEANNADRQVGDYHVLPESVAASMDIAALHQITVGQQVVLAFFAQQSMALQQVLLPVGTESMLAQAMRELESNVT